MDRLRLRPDPHLSSAKRRRAPRKLLDLPTVLRPLAPLAISRNSAPEPHAPQSSRCLPRRPLKPGAVESRERTSPSLKKIRAMADPLRAASSLRPHIPFPPKARVSLRPRALPSRSPSRRRPDLLEVRSLDLLQA